MNWSEDDKRLGMDRPITRRHFLDGVAAAAGAAVVFKMGGLRNKLPITFWTFALGTAAPIAVPRPRGSRSKKHVSDRTTPRIVPASGILGACTRLKARCMLRACRFDPPL